MRVILPCFLVGIATGTQLWADSPADLIRGLYKAVPQDRIRASPEADILAHIEGMRARRTFGEPSFAVPDLDIETVMQETGVEDVLMNPQVLEAIARMPADRAAQVLRMIQNRRDGLNPLENVPPLSLSEEVPKLKDLASRGWQLGRDADGAPILQNGEDATSRLPLVPRMVLADFGRVLSIQDDTEGFRITMEGGDVLEGEVHREELALVETGPVDPAPREDDATVGTPGGGTVSPSTPDAGADHAGTGMSGPPLRSPRPRARPVDRITQKNGDAR